MNQSAQSGGPLQQEHPARGASHSPKTSPGSPIQRLNLVDQVYVAIKEQIVSGYLTPGMQLKMETLSAQLGVSNSPIREALRRLENERWVETIPYRGSFVRPLDATELAELYEIREFIELAALGKAMPNPPAKQLTALRDARDKIVAALKQHDAAGYMKADSSFHQTIVNMAGNDRLSEMFATLVEQGRSFILGRTPEAMAACQDGLDQHAELFEYINRRETRKATSLLRHHLHISLDKLKKNVEQNQR